METENSDIWRYTLPAMRSTLSYVESVEFLLRGIDNKPPVVTPYLQGVACGYKLAVALIEDLHGPQSKEGKD